MLLFNVTFIRDTSDHALKKHQAVRILANAEVKKEAVANSKILVIKSNHIHFHFNFNICGGGCNVRASSGDR